MSSRSLDDLSPLVRPMIDAFLYACAGAGIDILVTCTLRSLGEQTALYAQGRPGGTPGPIVTDAKPGQSAHNYGFAMDVVPIVNGKPDWIGSDPVWAQIGNLAEAAGLEWAGRWISFPEKPHVELPNWQQHIGNPPT